MWIRALAVLLVAVAHSFETQLRKNWISLRVPASRLLRLVPGTKVSARPATAKIDFQSDDALFGRGQMHLSADLEEGNVVAYQTGTWLVDGVTVGDVTPAAISFCCIDTIQVVWTHNCEHGVLRGLELVVDDARMLVATGQVVEFGPEQLVARIPVEALDDGADWSRQRFRSLVDLHGQDWLVLEAS